MDHVSSAPYWWQSALSREQQDWVHEPVTAVRPASPFQAGATTVANVYGPGAVVAMGAHSAPTVYHTLPPSTPGVVGAAWSSPPAEAVVGPAATSSTTSGRNLPDVCPVTQLPYLDKRTRWTKNEELRLICCLLDSHDLTRGVSFLEYFRGARERQDLDRSLTDVEAALAAKFNDRQAAWPEFDMLDVIKRFPPTKDIRVPRRPDDLMSHWRKEVMDSLKSFSRAFSQSGRGAISEWDFKAHPLAEFMYKVDPDLLVMSTGTLIRTAEGQIPGDDESDSDGKADNDETDETVIPGPDLVVRKAKRRRIQQSVDDNTATLLTETLSQQRAMVGAVGQLTDMLRLFLEHVTHKDV